MTTRIATWNLWWRFGDHEARHAAIVAELARVRPAVLCLQEVWTETDQEVVAGDVRVEDETGDAVTQAGALATALGLPHWRSAWRVAHEGLSFGNAVLSRHPIRATHTLPLPTVDAHEEYRTALLVELETPAGPLAVATTHLSFRWDHSHVRQAQVHAICHWLADHHPADTPLVLTGDLNAEPVSDELRMLTGRAAVPVTGLGFHDAWETAGRGDGTTWAQANTHTPAPPFERDKRIDYVLCSHPLPGGRGVPVHAEVIGATPDPVAGHPSDHHGVVVDLTVAGPQ